MSALVLALVLGFADGIGFGDDMEDLRRALAAGDFRTAWARMEAEADPVLSARMQAEILYGAGDPARALAAARQGLERSPAQLELLYHAAGAAIWLQDGALAEELTGRLQQSVERSSALSASEAESWRGVASDFARRSRELLRHALERERAVMRARTLALAGLGLGLALSGLAGRKA